jgi:malonyl-CoA O-methyltransferase
MLRRLFKSSKSTPLNSLDAYARWVSSYPPHAHNALMHTEESAMRSLLPDLRGMTVLDLACGTGRYGLLAEQQGAALVVGTDNSAAMLASSPLKRLALSTVEAVPLADESMNVILCGLALGHLPQLLPTLREMARVLKPGGLALISDVHPMIALSGAQRTFTAADGKTYAVEHYPHLYSDYHKAAREAGLHIVDVIERPVEGAPSPAPAVIVYALAKSEPSLPRA